MELVKFAAAPLYSAPDHDDVVARRLQGGEASSADFVLTGHSVLTPGALIPMDAAPIGKIYVAVEGMITIEEMGGARHLLHPMDSIYVAPGEARAVRNETNSSAAMIVITPPAKAPI